jgi:hypothetical protein
VRAKVTQSGLQNVRVIERFEKVRIGCPKNRTDSTGVVSAGRGNFEFHQALLSRKLSSGLMRKSFLLLFFKKEDPSFHPP